MSYLEHSQQTNPSPQHSQSRNQQQSSQSQSQYPQQMSNLFPNQPFQRSQQPLSNLPGSQGQHQHQQQHQQQQQQQQLQQPSQPIPPQQFPARSRGDSIFLPPPISSSQIRPTSEQSYETTTANPRLNQSTGSTIGSRSNSIFSSLINIPGSNGNSISEQSGPLSQQQQQQLAASAGGSNLKSSTIGNQAPNLPPTSRSRQMSLVPNQEFTVEDLENLFGNNRESMANLFAWQQGDLKFSLSGASGGPTGSNANAAVAPNSVSGGKVKSGSLDLSAWIDNSNQPGSIGFNNSITEIIQNMISNGSIDFSNMNDQQRRDSILKIINDQTALRNPRASISSANSSNASTTLRQDIFKKGDEGTTKQGTGKANQGNERQGKRQRSKNEKELSPTSSVSSKASKRNDEPQSPKTSPTQYNNHRLVNPSYTQQPTYNQQPSVNSQGQKGFQANVNPLSPTNQYQYSSFPSFNNSLSFSAMSPGGTRQNSFMGGVPVSFVNSTTTSAGTNASSTDVLATRSSANATVSTAIFAASNCIPAATAATTAISAAAVLHVSAATISATSSERVTTATATATTTTADAAAATATAADC